MTTGLLMSQADRLPLLMVTQPTMHCLVFTLGTADGKYRKAYPE